MRRAPRLRRLRRMTQIGTLLLLVAIPMLCLQEITVITGTLYSIAVLGLEMTDPLMVLQHGLATRSLHATLLLSGLIPLVLALLLGPVFCSWVCPQGLVSELAENSLKSLTRHRRPVRLRTAAGSRPLWVRAKWAVPIAGALAVAFLSVPFFYYGSAPGVISRELASLVYLGTLGGELALVAVILLLEALGSPRAWCRILCPIGTVLCACRTPLTLQVRHDQNHRCDAGACGLSCAGACQLGIDPRIRKDLWLCNNCGDCVEACPDRALSWSFPLLTRTRSDPPASSPAPDRASYLAHRRGKGTE